jgi:hypothetical protein
MITIAPGSEGQLPEAVMLVAEIVVDRQVEIEGHRG